MVVNIARDAMNRIPWERDFPDVIVNCCWKSSESGVTGLGNHALYQAAKGERDVDAALALIDDVVVERTVATLRELEQNHKVKPKLIAPAAQLGDSNNALAMTYAQWLGHELGWAVDESVFQLKDFSKDKSNAWVRIAHRSAFYGEIDKTTPYVIVDDVITLGGTMADLRSFILGKGGRVIGMSTIASKDGNDVQIRLGSDTQTELEKFYGSDLAKFCNELLGFDHRGFTDPEAARVLGCSGYVDLRKKIVRGRDQGDSSRSAKQASR
ncbi:phosphoribosyltransferase [Rhizobium sp. S95]|uniref:Phosphoribosyltransferase n=1 Tax=Ciceribacter sichuanensis TaxID=2949647 RepID=A0AAJ1C0V3_9HYPH|nr:MULTISPECIES: phosphoribosyltransferase [unclassified Ciceribacter]MCM2399436.1 phosphoribosyltransferase [Ciceribacter sp. S95]MCO5959772.1 phosphoribosyltransferase [Ciceribacter sp. S101]